MITPLRDYVVLKDKVVEPTESGLILVESADLEPSNEGVVVKLPPAGLFQAPPFKEGDAVLFKRHMFEEYTVNKEKFLLGKQEGVIAVLD